jgi:multidrug efflux system membrane fusion protein
MPRLSISAFPTLRVTLLGGAALAALAGCADKKQQRNRPAIPVTVATVKKMDVPYTIEANGVVTPVQAANVASQVAGIIRRVAFQEGQDVTKGQVLFEIDPRPYQAAYQQALATLARDRATANNAERDAQRYASLAAQDYVTKEQADQMRATAEAQRATVAADEAAVANARFNLDNTTIRAPISGRTGALLVREGNLVSANGNVPLVTINQISPILVRFAIPSTQLPLLQRYGTAGGLTVSATPNTGTNTIVDTSANTPLGLAVGQGDPAPGGAGAGPAPAGPPSGAPTSQLTALSQPEHGSLFFIDNAVDTTTGTVQLKATFPNPNRRLWAGEFVATRLELFVEQNALVVPASAVVTGQQGQYVYVVTDSMTAQQRPVSVERTAGSLMVIAAGLREGERVVSDGQSRLTPNAKVVINTPQGAPAGGRQRGGGAGHHGAGPATDGARGGAQGTGARGGANGTRGPAGAGGTPQP